MSTPTSLELPDRARRTTVSCARGTFAALEAFPASGTCELGTALLVPGYTGSKEDFIPLLGPLAAAGRRVVAIDMRGQYQTPGPDDPAAYRLAGASRRHQRRSQGHGHHPPARPLLRRPGRPRGRPGRLHPRLPDPDELRPVRPAWPPSRRPPRHAGLPGRHPHPGPQSQNRRNLARRPGTRRPIDSAVTPRILAFLKRAHARQQPHRPGHHGEQPAHRQRTRPKAWHAATSPPSSSTAKTTTPGPPRCKQKWPPALGAEQFCIPGAAHNPNVEAPATTAHALTSFWTSAEANGAAV